MSKRDFFRNKGFNKKRTEGEPPKKKMKDKENIDPNEGHSGPGEFDMSNDPHLAQETGMDQDPNSIMNIAGTGSNSNNGPAIVREGVTNELLHPQNSSNKASFTIRKRKRFR